MFWGILLGFYWAFLGCLFGHFWGIFLDVVLGFLGHIFIHLLGYFLGLFLGIFLGVFCTLNVNKVPEFIKKEQNRACLSKEVPANVLKSTSYQRCVRKCMSKG